jgi:hypothetical protein
MHIEDYIRKQAINRNLPVRIIRQEVRDQLEESLGISKKRTRVFSDEDREMILRLADEDATITHIAGVLGKTNNQVRGVLLQMGVKGLRN